MIAPPCQIILILVTSYLLLDTSYLMIVTWFVNLGYHFRLSSFLRLSSFCMMHDAWRGCMMSSESSNYKLVPLDKVLVLKFVLTRTDRTRYRGQDGSWPNHNKQNCTRLNKYKNQIWRFFWQIEAHACSSSSLILSLTISTTRSNFTQLRVFSWIIAVSVDFISWQTKKRFETYKFSFKKIVGLFLVLITFEIFLPEIPTNKCMWHKYTNFWHFLSFYIQDIYKQLFTSAKGGAFPILISKVLIHNIWLLPRGQLKIIKIW